jgi:hypothetical protein
VVSGSCWAPSPTCGMQSKVGTLCSMRSGMGLRNRRLSCLVPNAAIVALPSSG